MANVFQPILNQPSSPVQVLPTVQRPDVTGQIIDLGTKAFDVGGDIIVQQTVVGESRHPEQVDPDVEGAQLLGGLSEDAAIEQEVTFSRIKAAWLAGLRGDRAKALVDSKVKQAINKYPFLANKIRKKRDEFFGSGAGGGGSFFKDPADPVLQLGVKLAASHDIEATDLGNREAIIAAQNRLVSSKLADDKIKSSNLKLENKAKLSEAEETKTNQEWEQAISDLTVSQLPRIDIRSQALINAFRTDIPQGIKQTDAFFNGLRDELIRKAPSPEQSKSIKPYLNDIEKKRELVKQNLSGSMSDTAYAKQQDIIKSRINNWFLQRNSKHAGVWSQSKFVGFSAVPGNQKAQEAFNTYYSSMLSAADHKLQNVYDYPDEVYSVLTGTYANLEEALSAGRPIQPGDTKDLSNGAASLINAMGKEGASDSAMTPEKAVKVDKFTGSVGFGNAVAEHPELVSEEDKDKFTEVKKLQVEQMLSVFTQSFTPEQSFLEFTGDVAQSVVAGTGITRVEGPSFSEIDAMFVEPFSTGTGILFRVVPDSNLPPEEIERLTKGAVAVLNKDLVPSLNLKGRSIANVNGDVSNPGPAMEAVVAMWNQPRRQTILSAVAGIKDRLEALDVEAAGIRTGVGAGPKLNSIDAERDALQAKLDRFHSTGGAFAGKPKPGSPEDTASNLRRELSDLNTQLRSSIGFIPKEDREKLSVRMDKVRAELQVVSAGIKRSNKKARDRQRWEAAGLTPKQIAILEADRAEFDTPVEEEVPVPERTTLAEPEKADTTLIDTVPTPVDAQEAEFAAAREAPGQVGEIAPIVGNIPEILDTAPKTGSLEGVGGQIVDSVLSVAGGLRASEEVGLVAEQESRVAPAAGLKPLSTITSEELQEVLGLDGFKTKLAKLKDMGFDLASTVLHRVSKELGVGKAKFKAGDPLDKILIAEEGSVAAQKRTGSFRDGKFFEYADRNQDDSVNGVVIGYGHEVLGDESFPDGITVKEAEVLLVKDIAKAKRQANEIAKENNIPLTPRQSNALTEMVFQMGAGSHEARTGVRGFRDMLAALAAGDLDTARKEALNSEWHDKDTRLRAERVVDRFFG